MAEQDKQQEQKGEGKKTMSVILKVLLGLVFLGLAAYLLVARQWWEYTWYMIKAAAGPCLILAGIITLAIAKE